MAANSSHERNLLFAGLGLQLSLFTKEQLVRAFSEWILNKNQSLGEILVQQKAISEDKKKAIQGAVEAQIQNDGNELQALASVKNAQEIETILKNIEDPELQMTLCTMHALQSRKIVGNEGEQEGTAIPQGFQQPLPGKKPSEHRFQRVHFLDAGNLGEIWFAKDEELNRTVVLKYIKAEQQGNSFTKALFNLEGEITGYLEHPAVVPVYSMGQDAKGRSFYAMRYIRGRKLTRAIADYHALPASSFGKKREALTELLQSFQTACWAIEFAHSKGVLHCDVKPDNIMVGPFGETLVIDWGLAMVTNPSAEIAQEVQALEDMQMTTATGGWPMSYSPSQSARPGLHTSQGGKRKFVGGTPAYIAPEQMRATRGGEMKEVTRSSDIFGLGAILYHLLVSQPPYFPNKEKREGNEEFFQRIEKGDCPRPSHLSPGISKPLEAVVLKAMAANPAERYGSARDLAEEVRRWLADEPVHAYQENAYEKSRRWARNHRTSVVSGILLLICLAVGGLGFGIVTQGFNEKLHKQERLANKQRELAEIREGMAIASVKQYAEAVEKNPDLKNRPELEALRKELLKEPVQFFKELSDQLRSEKNPSTKSLADLASGLHSLANLTAEIGNQEDALRSYKEAITIREKLIQTNPTNSNFQADLALSHNNLANLYFELTQTKEAEIGFRNALAIRDTLVKANPTNTEFQFLLARSHTNLALLFSKTNRLMDAEESHHKALAIQDLLVKANPSNSEFQSDLAWSLNILAALCRKTNRFKEAEECYQKALAIQEILVKEIPLKSGFKFDLANTHHNLGNLYNEMNRLEEAEKSHIKALAIQDPLVKANPTNSEFQFGLAGSHNNLATLYTITNRLGEAEESHLKALAILVALVRTNPTNSWFQADLAWSHKNYAKLCRDTNRLKEAVESYQKALAILKSLVDGNPTISEFQFKFADSHYNYAKLCRDTNRLKEAEISLQKALSLQNALVKDNPTNSEYQSALANTKNTLAWELVSIQGNGEKDYQNGLILAQEALKLNPQRGMILNTLGVAQYRVKQFPAALETLLKSNEINAKTNGKEDSSDLAFLAMTCHQLNKKTEAETYFKKLLDAMKEKKNSENKEYQEFLKEAEALLKK